LQEGRAAGSAEVSICEHIFADDDKTLTVLPISAEMLKGFPLPVRAPRLPSSIAPFTVGALLVTLAQGSASAITVFPLQFDNRGLIPQSIQPVPPFVGQGTFSFDDDLQDGSHLFNSLSNPAMSVVIGGEAFSLADKLLYDKSLAVVIFDGGSRFYFDGPQAANSILGGSLELTNARFSTLAFEPSGYTLPPYNLYLSIGPNSSVAGTYGNLVPAPLPFVGIAAALASTRRLRRRLHQANSSLQR
jgi:hypothetical protein